MKKFGRKLFLSCAALAACATTLVSTTFAWYTSNTEVTATSVSGASDALAASSDIYIKGAASYSGREASTFGAYGSSATTKATVTTPILTPVYYNSTDKTLKKMGNNATVDAAISNSDVLEFTYRFMSGSTAETPVYFKTLEITNTESSLPTLTPIKADSDDGVSNTGITNKNAYGIDFLKAVKMSVTCTVYDVDADTAAETKTSATGNSVYGLDAYATLGTTTNVSVSDTANAHTYYAAVTGKTLTKPTSNYTEGEEITISAGSVALFTIPAGNVVEVTFMFYLDGWDNYCYDVCRQQGLNVEMSFTTSSDASGITLPYSVTIA